jgi:membrane-associated protease RseP (regulator of RpoE activity)
MSRITKTFATLALWGLATAPNATAQDTLGTARVCPAGAAVIGHLGYERLNCRNCTYYVDEEQPMNTRWQFNAEPVIMSVRRGGPADGKLENGDVIVAIDGALITSAEGGRHFGQLQPGEPIDLTVRRGGRELSVEITSTARCQGTRGVAPPAPVPIPGRVAVPRIQVVTPRPPVALPLLPTALPRGWFGFSIRCSDCGISIGDDREQVWHFASPPTIQNVESESPADRAGILVGDRITSIDGLDITTSEGGSSFGHILPGDTVTFGLRRNGVDRSVQIAAGMRELPSPAPTPGGIVEVPQPDARRFSGVIGDALVEVTGGPIMVRRTEDEIVIRSGDITVRIKRTGK